MRNGVCFKELCDKCFGNLIASFLVISCASFSQINNQNIELSIKIIEFNIQIHCIQNKEWPHNYIDLNVIATWNLFL